ncbi:hypothetical protein PGT21_034677 [Puccinia graminis f. sp. tritici]|uniref:Uncharacterized protein n=1 Tax=Puccinia graminis f. sp. tritici TaxID=56615 RepID=A0A5B0N632_PUCGR|nr:hypothetical protein PGTUg99_019275 [Puccinia graminis f. sp. tritici]KAA1084715.1 hypothetical protein PGT21_034677 [Puccinia graminis f. sp. tritici]
MNKTFHRSNEKMNQAVEEANRGLDSANELQISTTTDEEELTPIPATVESLIPQSLDQPAFLPNQCEHTLLISPGDFNNNNTHDDVPKAPESRLVQSDFVSSTAPKPQKNVNPPEPTSTTYCFYQAASGEQIYLSALDIRVLLTKFGSFDCFPSSITLKVEGWSEVRVSDDLRRRCRYLSHLPMGSEVQMVKVDLDEYLGDDCSLVEAVRKRRAKRREKTKKEDKAKTKSEMVNQSSWNTFTTKSIPDWVAPVGVKDHQTSGPMNHPSSAEALVSVDLSGGWCVDQLVGRDSFRQAGLSTGLPGGTPPDEQVKRGSGWEGPGSYGIARS